MSGISGSLEDVSVADVMQFIHLGRRTGTLVLAADGERAMIGFHGGKLVIGALARHTQARRPAGLLRLLSRAAARGGDPGRRASASAGPPRADPGRRGAIGAEALRQVVVQQIERDDLRVVGWDRGSFEFVVDDLRRSTTSPSTRATWSPTPTSTPRWCCSRRRGSSTSAARRRDRRTRRRPRRAGRRRRRTLRAERRRRRRAGRSAWSKGAPPETAVGVPELQVVSADAALVDGPRRRGRRTGGGGGRPVDRREAGELFPGRRGADRPPRPAPGGAAIEDLARLRRRAPRRRWSPWSIPARRSPGLRGRRGGGAAGGPDASSPASTTSCAAAPRRRLGRIAARPRRPRRRGAAAPGVRRPALGADLGDRGAQPDAHHLGVGRARRALPGQARRPDRPRRLRQRRRRPPARRAHPRPAPRPRRRQRPHPQPRHGPRRSTALRRGRAAREAGRASSAAPPTARWSSSRCSAPSA
jgi:hypothetical protein